MQQTLQLQTDGQDGDQETCSDDKREVAGYQVLQTEVQACTHWSLPDTIRRRRGPHMRVVRRRWRRDSGPDARKPLAPQQPVKRPAESTMEGGGKGDGLESRQMQTRADL